MRIRIERSDFHFIRSSDIVGTLVPTEAQITRLKEASGMVLGTLDPGLIIFDADVRSSRGFPVMLFGDDGLDLTAQVRQVYDAIGGGPVEVAGGGSGGADEP